MGFAGGAGSTPASRLMIRAMIRIRLSAPGWDVAQRWPGIQSNQRSVMSTSSAPIKAPTSPCLLKMALNSTQGRGEEVDLANWPITAGNIITRQNNQPGTDSH